MGEPYTVFCCYAHQDRHFLLELKKHLIPLEREGLIIIQADIDINPGMMWRRTINHNLETAHIILLLLSPDFMASDYCYKQEMQQAIKRHIKGKCRVIPIIVRPTFWQGTPLLSELQALPIGAEAISTWQNQDEAFANVVNGIHKVIQEFASGGAPKIVNHSLSPERPSAYAEINAFLLGFLIGPLAFLPFFTEKQNEETNDLLFCRFHAKTFATALEIAFDVDVVVDVNYWFNYTFQALEIAYSKHVALCLKLGYLLISFVILRGMYPVREDCPQYMADQIEQLLREAAASVGVDESYLEDLIKACKSQQIGEDKDKYIRGIGAETAEKIATYLETSKHGDQKQAKKGGFSFLRNLF